MPGFLKPRTWPTYLPEKRRDTYFRITGRAGTQGDTIGDIGDRIKKLHKRVVDEVKEARWNIRHTYCLPEEQCSGNIDTHTSETCVTHPLLITIIVFGCTFLIISIQGIIVGFKRRIAAS